MMLMMHYTSHPHTPFTHFARSPRLPAGFRDMSIYICVCVVVKRFLLLIEKLTANTNLLDLFGSLHPGGRMRHSRRQGVHTLRQFVFS